ncbi:hypothetical protein [Micromonospora sp. NPDC048830]|uniref:hypothetical protein n=1 Tax=Micromonospora sp. NPDC048830 TaxID=3364257 RepID=UPI0037237DB3
MEFQMFPPDEPLALAPGKTGPLCAFFVPIQVERTFLRLIALWTDNAALEGAAPTIQIKANDGVITSVKADAGDVDIPTTDDVAGTANCRRLPGDVYLVTIANLPGRDTHWQLRVRNNADRDLRFVWVSSHEEEATLQPWMAVGDQRDETGRRVVSLVGRRTDQFVAVRNLGTRPLEIRDMLDTPVGGQDSPVRLVSRPAVVAPHGVDHIVLRCEEIDAPLDLSHTFDANDEEPTHRTLRITVTPP